MILWISLSVAVVVAVLVAVLATSKPASQIEGQSPLLGKPAPGISGASLTGTGQVQLSSYLGRWVVVNFMASWCVPCQEEMPQLLAYAQRHQGSAAPVLLSVEYDEGDAGALRSFLRSRDATWPAVVDAQAKVDYGVSGIPQSYLIDPEGTVVVKINGEINADQLDTDIASLGGEASVLGGASGATAPGTSSTP